MLSAEIGATDSRTASTRGIGREAFQFAFPYPCAVSVLEALRASEPPVAMPKSGGVVHHGNKMSACKLDLPAHLRGGFGFRRNGGPRHLHAIAATVYLGDEGNDIELAHNNPLIIPTQNRKYSGSEL